MKKLLLILLFLGLTQYANAQCVAEVKDVIIDQDRGSIIVETQYKLNGTVVDVNALPCDNCVGKSRYTEQNGTIQEIALMAKADIERHCSNVIIRNAINVNGLNNKKLQIQKALTEPLLPTLRENAIGWTKEINDTTFTFKNKEITVNADGTYTVSDITP